ncbi:hypothetical protein FA09DRAFT_332421 [Tilletiopsis washingtonensis]|uniref:Integral membrane protein n=1 Tax=Tilletiopsis washingtonensis TaxID=58919 RepID=A0A316YZW7_9BASI|nr:hypothetical protein FA09DRAFT_332421 [Tilletiopsis washingtonensis]PWN95000.1 hypothetical protein FA09DRAFT_332421 [Tilletiopsis washingtonensis]
MGRDWMSPAEMARDLFAGQIMLGACIGAMFIETIHTFYFDLGLLRRAGSSGLRWPQAAYFLCKIAWVPMVATTFAVAAPPNKMDCDSTMMASEALVGIVTTMSSALLAFRALCVYQGAARTWVGRFLFAAWLGMFGIWMSGIPDLRGAWFEGIGPVWLENSGACAFLPGLDHMKYASKFLYTVAFDFVVLVLTVVGVLRMKSSSRLGRILIEQGTIYFVIILVANTLLVTLNLLQLNPVMSTVINPPVQTLHVIVATRLFMSLSKEARIAGVNSHSGSTSTKRHSHSHHTGSGSATAHHRQASSLPTHASQHDTLHTNTAVTAPGKDRKRCRACSCEKLTATSSRGSHELSEDLESHRGETSHVLDDDSHVSQDGTALTTRDVYPMVPSQQFVR